jgi:hypothetical protein
MQKHNIFQGLVIFFLRILVLPVSIHPFPGVLKQPQ